MLEGIKRPFLILLIVCLVLAAALGGVLISSTIMTLIDGLAEGSTEPTAVHTPPLTGAPTPGQLSPLPTATVPPETATPTPSPEPQTSITEEPESTWRIAELSGMGSDCTDLDFGPDGATLAIAGRDGVVRLIDAVTGAVQHTLEGHTMQVNQVAFAPDGSWLLSAADDGMLLRWDVASGEQLAVLGDRTLGKLTALDISPGTDWIASGNATGVVSLWNANTGERSFRFDNRHLTRVSGLGFGPDGSQFASADLNGWIVLSPVDGNPGEVFVRDPDPVNDVAYTLDGRLVTANMQGVWVWDVATGVGLVLEPAPAVGTVDRLAVSADGILLAALARSGAVWIWELAELSLQATIPPEVARARSLAFSPTCDACPTEPGWMLAIGGENGRVWLWGIEQVPAE